jgi:hypothetical protein
MFHGWDNFFVMAGSSAATLIGLLFVAITVGTGLSSSGKVQGTRGFVTPTLVHFAGVLFLAFTVLVPWTSAWPIGIILGLGGLTGLGYQIHTSLMRQTVGFVSLGWDDWIPWVVLPALANASLVAGAVGLIAGKAFAAYAVAGSIVLLLFAGIYGAWDLTLWIIKKRDKT